MAASVGPSDPALESGRAIARSALRSGATFGGADLRAMQEDDFANPGMLWVERGEALWRASAPGGSCATCHGASAASMRGVAARHPAFDPASGEVLDLEARINACRQRRQHVAGLPRESEDLLALSAFVARQSRGMPVHAAVDGGARPAFERGHAFYYERHGQMNLSCANCHEEHWGGRLLAETISQGQPTAYPGYRLEWQTLGSLNRRLRACLFGIRADPLEPDARLLVDLALFLAWRADGLAIEAPGVRR